MLRLRLLRRRYPRLILQVLMMLLMLLPHLCSLLYWLHMLQLMLLTPLSRRLWPMLLQLLRARITH